MSPPSRRTKKPLADALRAGALVSGVFLALLGTLRAALRLHLLPRNELAILLPVAILVVLVPLGVGIKLGFRDETPPSLRAYRHALPWSRSPTEELLGAVLGGAFWSALSMGIAALLERLVPVPAIGAIGMVMMSPALAAAALWKIHGVTWSTSRALGTIFTVALLLATPQLALAPRGPLGAREGLSVLAREYFEAAERSPQRPALARHALALALQGCDAGQARACVLASFAFAGREGSPEASELLLRRACDLTSADLALCARFVGEPFATGGASPCSVEERCAAGHGVDCKAGLLGCKQLMSPAGLTPACSRRDAAGWREVWCGAPR
jgi:hypothetical protein